ncbi:MAG: response regulator, partial [Deltaproteobacteria bacterium]|nr:response regulator [Deltaproteobacteria bacterium]
AKKEPEPDKLAFDSSIQKGTERILLVDDEDVIADMEKQMLERLGYRVTARASSTDALAAFRTQPDKFDLVITDMTMPNMTGDKLAGELIKTRSDIPIILCTGFSELVSKEKAAALGIKGFLMKPLLREEMAHTIRKVLDEAKGSTQQ